MKTILCCGAALLLNFANVQVHALEPFVVLDDFSGNRIDETLWNGSRRTDSDIMDFARGVSFGRLHLLNRSFADTPPPGGTNFTAVRLFLNDSEPVTATRARVQVTDVEMRGCDASGTTSNIEVRHGGYYFNDGSIGDPFDATDDVFATIGVRRRSDSPDPPGILEVRGNVFLCGDPNCDTGVNLFQETAAFGPVMVGDWTRLTLWWDPDNDRFLFQRDSQLPIVYSYLGILDDGGDPPNPPASGLSFVHKRVEIRGIIENCEFGSRAEGVIDAQIDNFRVNQSAVSP